MSTILAAQLSQIAVNSNNSLNLKVQKAAHSKSLIFDPRVAASQTFDVVYTLCHEGFQELCLLDGRFLEYQRDIFSEQSQEQDRSQITSEQNSELDRRIESFLGLVGGRLRLNPAIKAVEWLVRRFRIHEHNTSVLLTTFLPYHTLPIFTTLLSILPSNIPHEFKFLHPFIRSLTEPSRHAIVQAATNNAPFASLLNSYVLRISHTRQHSPALLAFWAGLMTEAVGGMMDKSRSGRRDVQHQNEQDVILRLLPTLNEGLAMRKVPDLRVACYMILSVMASKGDLDDKVLTAMMEAVVLGWTTETTTPGLVCLALLAQQRGSKQLTKRLTKELLKVPEVADLLVELSKRQRLDKLCNGFCLALIDRLRKHGETTGLPIVEKSIANGLLNDHQSTVIFKALLLVAYQVKEEDPAQMHARLASTLVNITQLSGHIGSVIRNALEDSEVDIDELELKLHAAIRPVGQLEPLSEDLEMENSNASEATTVPDLHTLFQRIPKRTTTETSFLSHDPSHVYPELCRAFLVASADATHLQAFDQLPILRKESALQETIYFSFFMKTWCGPYPVVVRASALEMATRCLSKSTEMIDTQAMLPYVIAALGDVASRVRRAAANFLVVLNTSYPSGFDAKNKKANIKKWATMDIYGPGKESKDIQWLSVETVSRLLRDILIPALEECVLDRTHIGSVLQRSLDKDRSSDSPKKSDTIRLAQNARHSIMSFLSSHVIHTPLYSVKARLLASLNQIKSVAGTSRTKFLLPVLQHWASLDMSTVLTHCHDEHLDVAEIDDQMLMIVTPNDKDGIQLITDTINGDLAVDRNQFLRAVLKRLRAMWSSLKGELRMSTAQMLMDSSQSSTGQAGNEHQQQASQESAEFLRTVTLHTDILVSFLEQLPTAAKLADKAPATKRRRTSHGEVARTTIQDSKQLDAAINKVTFVLQLVDSSDPGKHPELTRGLFNTLAELQHFKAQVSSELAYLQGLVLGCLLEIQKAHQSSHGTKVDPSAIRADLLVDCIQKTSSPQVQNSALLLVASLADTAPELVLHSVMPIFTFMGNSVLRQNDEYSAHVITQTIREVIPPLISSLRKEKGNPVTGAAELLLSFVAAYKHVPPHRRKGLFVSLVQTLGAEDFLFALIAMLVDKYGPVDDVKSFAIDISGSFSVEVQLSSAVKCLDLVDDVLKPKPLYSNVLLGANDEGILEPHRVAVDELALLPDLLSERRLVVQTAKLLNRDDMDAARVRDIYSTLLEKLLALADSVKEQKMLHGACGDVLESVLGLLSTSEFVKSVEGLLDRPDESLRRKILRSLEVRIDQESPSDVASRVAMLGFLPQLTAIIRDSEDILYKHTAVSCVDKISEKYGKKDLEAVAAAAEMIASTHCLGQSDNRLRVMALLCLSSLVDILREGLVSVLPIAIPKTLEYMEESVKNDDDSQKLHNAGYAFFSALIQHLPYMVSGNYLDKLLEISNTSAEADLDEESDESRLQCLEIAGMKLDARSLFGALEKDWDRAAITGPLALREYLDVLGVAIERHPKSTITKHAHLLAKIFQNAFDLRRQWITSTNDKYNLETLFEIQAVVNELAIKMIYKFNDATFRPIFSNLVDWAASGLPKKDRTGRILRLQSVYSFMTVFFDNLKSIVSSYATYFLENAADILKTVDLKDEESKELWASVLKTLTKCFEHDQDDFWQSPSHFSVIAPVLCAQFQHASSLPLASELIPAITELSSAADSPEHHKELNGAILKHMRAGSANIRLAAVQCEQGLVDRVGEEWLSMLPEMLPFISELQDDDDDVVERETHRWIVKIEGVLGESLDSMLQ